MKIERYNLWQTTEYSYPMACGFMPNIMAYLHEDERIRPCMLIAPGGGYEIVSTPEGEVVAREFYERGYNTFVCSYTINYANNAPLKMQPMQDIARAVRFIRKNASEFQIDSNKVVVCGFSAGAHLCGSLCVHYEDCEELNETYQAFSARPDASILSYPVITSGSYAHRGSFDTLLGADATEEELTYMSLEKQVTKDTPPCFLWQTVDDETVPVQNSYLYALALLDNQVPYAHHIFSSGYHGIALANEDWASSKYDDLYTMDQVLRICDGICSGEITNGNKSIEEIQERFADRSKIAIGLCGVATPNQEVMAWPELADLWIHKIWNTLKTVG